MPVPRIQEVAHYTQIAEASWKASSDGATPARATIGSRQSQDMSKLVKLMLFLGASAVLGLAAAFVLLLVKPDLLPRTVVQVPAPAATPTVAVAPSEPVAVAAATPVGSYADAVARSSPAVVNVYAARVVTERTFPSQFDSLFGDVWPSVRQRVDRSLGSGVVVDKDGHIVTNYHVIANADEIRVQLADGRQATAEVVGRDPDTDLAVLRVKLGKLPVMALGHSDQLRVGDVVLAIGNPLGLGQTVTQGIVSATGRGQLGVATFENFIQTDAAINFGNSGGALINARGELVGINTAVLSKSMGTEGIGFAIPVNLVRGVMAEILKNGKVVRGWFGIVPQDLSEDDARQLGVADGVAIELANLYLNSPAYDAGLRPGDVIVAINGKPVHSAQESLAIIAALRPGAPLKVSGLRRGVAFEIDSKVIERPAKVS
jgi:Do/DeqQ family serine protease